MNDLFYYCSSNKKVNTFPNITDNFALSFLHSFFFYLSSNIFLFILPPFSFTFFTKSIQPSSPIIISIVKAKVKTNSNPDQSCPFLLIFFHFLSCFPSLLPSLKNLSNLSAFFSSDYSHLRINPLALKTPFLKKKYSSRFLSKKSLLGKKKNSSIIQNFKLP